MKSVLDVIFAISLVGSIFIALLLIKTGLGNSKVMTVLSGIFAAGSFATALYALSQNDFKFDMLGLTLSFLPSVLLSLAVVCRALDLWGDGKARTS